MSQLLDKLTSKEGYEKTKVFYQHLKEAAFARGIPLFGLFELTPRCNLDCKMCYVHLNPGQIKGEELTTEQWISLIDDACRAGMMYATLTGGECLLHPGFKKIYEHLQASGVLVTILTNGTLLDEEMVVWIADKSPQRVQISVYGSSPGGYKAVTGCAEAFHKVDRAIELIEKAGIPFNLAITVSRQMLNDFEATLRYCKSKKPSSCNINPWPFEPREGTGRVYEDYAPSLDEQVKIFRIQDKLRDENIQAHYCEGQAEKTGKETERTFCPEKGIACSAGRNSFSVSWDGRMLPCSIFNFAEAYPLRDGFLNSWQSMNRKCREYLNPVECVGCEYYSVCRSCPAGHYLRVGQGCANPAVCAEGRRMVAEKLRFL
jgi:radical SAM protein with 4Fe4S-binding SPASM domain